MPSMLDAHTRAHGLAVHAYTESEKALTGPLSGERFEIGEPASSAPLIIQTIRYHPLKAAVTAIVITLSTLAWFTLQSLSPVQLLIPAAINPSYSSPHYARALTSSFLEVFQIYPPVLTVAPGGGALEITDGSSNASVEIVDVDRSTCQEVLVVHSFAFSYGQPFVGNYTPPPCKFNRVTWNLTVVSAGRQFDRLGIVYLGDIEVFRTSTAEPTANGIEWTYLKDMTNYLSLFKQDQKIIFDLGNLISDVYTAAYNVTLTAAFFTADDSITPADLILPVSARESAENMPSVFTVPPDTASNDLTLPRNTKRAVFTVAATGQSDEETGGVVPGLWRPIVGIDAFDLKEDEIDITPWLPLLCDGNPHNFTIRVSGLNDNGNGTASLSETTDSYWLVTGKVFIWLDVAGHITTGQGPYKVTPTPKFLVSSSIGTGANGTNETLLYQVNAQRSLSFQSTINLSHGQQPAFWRQQRTFSNVGNYTEGGNIEINTQQTTGYDESSSGYQRAISYPLYAYSAVETLGDNISIVATVNRGKDVQTIGQPVFPTGLESFANIASVHPMYPSFEGSSLSTTQNGTATYLANETSSTSFSFGTTSQEMIFSGIKVGNARSGQGFPSIQGSNELFYRKAVAVNGTVVEDEETLVEEQIQHPHGRPDSGHGFLITNIPGRGSDWHGRGGSGQGPRM